MQIAFTRLVLSLVCNPNPQSHWSWFSPHLHKFCINSALPGQSGFFGPQEPWNKEDSEEKKNLPHVLFLPALLDSPAVQLP